MLCASFGSVVHIVGIGMRSLLKLSSSGAQQGDVNGDYCCTALRRCLTGGDCSDAPRCADSIGRLDPYSASVIRRQHVQRYVVRRHGRQTPQDVVLEFEPSGRAQLVALEGEVLNRFESLRQGAYQRDDHLSPVKNAPRCVAGAAVCDGIPRWCRALLEAPLRQDIAWHACAVDVLSDKWVLIEKFAAVKAFRLRSSTPPIGPLWSLFKRPGSGRVDVVVGYPWTKESSDETASSHT